MQTYDYSKLLSPTRGPWGDTVPSVYHEGDGVQFRSPRKGNELLQETVRISDQAFLLASDYTPESDHTHRQIVDDADWIHVQIRFGGGGFERLSQHRIDTPEKSCIVSRYPRASLIERQIPAAQRFRHVCLFASPGALAELLDVPASRMPESAAWLTDEEEFRFENRLLELSPAMAVAANDVLACRLSGDSRRAFMRGKALEMLAAAMSALDTGTRPPERRTLRLKSADVDRIATARDIMISDLEATLTLGALARRVGLNRTKLAVGFKDQYGVSVGAFWRDLRLTKARELLQSSAMPVTEVALSLGYAELSSFTRAFVRKYGMLPSDYKRDRNRRLSRD